MNLSKTILTPVRLLSLAVITLSLIGCGSTLPRQTPPIQTEEEVRRISDSWNTAPAVNIVDVPGPSVLQVPGVFPSELDDMFVEIDVGRNHTLRDFMAVLGMQGIPGILADDLVGDIHIPIQSYKGSVSRLLKSIARARDISFLWDDGTLIAGKSGRYLFSIVQNGDAGDKIVKELGGIGAENATYSVTSGLIKFDAPWSLHDEVMEYMTRITEGMGTISLQVSVITVSLDRQSATGFDWSAMSMDTRGGIGGASIGGGSSVIDPMAGVEDDDDNDSSSDSDSGSGGSVGSDVAAVTSGVLSGVRSSITSDSVKFLFDRGSFSMSGLFSTLRKYGETRSSQNLVLKTLPGSEVKIRSGNSIPYVSGVSSNISSQTGTTNTSTVEVDNVESGLTVTMVPFLDATSGIVTIEMEMEIKSLLGFVEISAGNQAGTFSQPNVQEQSFNDIARLNLGETVIVGGVTFESSSDIRNTMMGLEDLPLGHQNDTVKREALFIVIRPTAHVYRFNDTSIRESADALNSRMVFEGREVMPFDWMEKAAEDAAVESDEAREVDEAAATVPLAPQAAAREEVVSDGE